MRKFGLALLSWGMLLGGCDQKNEPQPVAEDTQQPSTVGKQGKAVAEPVADSKEAPLAPRAKSAEGETKSSSEGKCPEGTWRYDYAGFARDVIFAGLPKVEIKESSGAYICQLEGLNPGKMTCRSEAGKPIKIDAGAEQMGMPLVVHFEMSGTSVTDYVADKPGVLRVTNSDYSGLQMKVSATVAGNKIDIPFQDWSQAFGAKEHNLLYWCEGGEMYMRGDFKELEDVRVRLTPVAK